MARVWDTLIGLLGLYPSGDLGPYTIYTSKRHKIVFFPKAPPKKPPTELQRRERAIFTSVAFLWRALPAATRADWKLATQRARLTISGYNLFTYYHSTKDREAIATVERHSGIALL